MKRLVIVGAGGFGREALDVLRAMDPEQSQFEFVGFVAADEPQIGLLERIDARWLGNDQQFLSKPSATHFVVAIGMPRLRRTVASAFEAVGLMPATLIHPSATVGHDVEIGEGSVLCAQSNITTNIRIGRHVHIDRVATVGHDCVVGDYVTMHPAAVVSGNVRIGEGARLGTNSCVLPGLTIGDGATVGAGAVVTVDVGDRQTVVGVPARPIG